MKQLKNIAALLLVGAIGVSFMPSRHEGHDHGLHVGEKAPKTNYEMTNVDGTTWTLQGAKGANGLLVIFSCNTCPFVVGSDAFPGWESKYNALAEEASSQGIATILINSNEGKRDNEDSFEAMKKHAQDQGYKMPYLLDKQSVLADAFGAKTTPHVYLFDADLKLIYMGAIDNTYDPKRKSDEMYLRNALSNLKARENVTLPSTTPRGCTIKRIAK